MNFFLDENFPKSSYRYLKSIGHKIEDIRTTSQEGISDKEIFDLAQESKSVFLTTDRDFFHTIPHLFPKHFGVVVIALKQPNRESILEKLKWVVANFDLKNFQNKIILLRDNYYTISGK